MFGIEQNCADAGRSKREKVLKKKTFRVTAFAPLNILIICGPNAELAGRWPVIDFVRICAKRRTKASTGQWSG